MVLAQPALVLEPASVELGRQAENKGEYAFSFKVKNGGDQELQVSQVRAGCSCTKVTMAKKTLAPGEVSEITGVLTTKGIEGEMRKSITVTSNDPVHPNVVASIAVRFPLGGVGLRLKGATSYAQLRDGVLRAYLTVENCETDAPIEVTAIELPQGWECMQKLPLSVKPEGRGTMVLTRKQEAGADVSAFSNLPFVVVTSSAKTPRVQGSLAYLPTVPTSQPAPAPMAPTGPQVRWPMTKPAPAPAATPASPPAPAAAAGAPAAK